MGSALRCNRRLVLRGVALTAGLATLPILSSCSKDQVTAKGSLQILGNPYNEATYRTLGRVYRRPVEVGFTPRESQDIVRQLLLRAFSGAALPDVLFLNGDLVRLFVERGLAKPMLDAAGGDAIRTTRFGGKIYGIPFGLSLPVILYNRELAAKAGFDPNKPPPASWDQILTLARRIGEAAPGAIGGFMEHDSGGAFGLLILMESAGVPLLALDGQELGFLGRDGADALRILRGFGEAGQARSDMDRRQARRAFQAGRIGVFATMSSIVPGLRSTRGALPFTVGPVPLAKEGGRLPAAGPVGIILSQDPARRAEAADFLTFAATAGQAILTQTSGYLPANPKGGSRAETLRALADPSRITGWFTFPGRNAVKICDIIQDGLQQVATLSLTPEDAIAHWAGMLPPLLARQAQGQFG